MRLGELRHIAMSVPDPWATAEFYKAIFGFDSVGETDSSLAEGVFLSDGLVNMALQAGGRKDRRARRRVIAA
jgi:methylmalonyl-CoA/ethylmalonyl-CoA epimerase